MPRNRMEGRCRAHVWRKKSELIRDAISDAWFYLVQPNMMQQRKNAERAGKKRKNRYHNGTIVEK